MRYKLKYKPLQLALCASLMCAAFASCSNSESDSMTAADDVKVPLSISAVIQSGTEARKADYDATAFEAGDEIGLFILSSEDYASAYSSDYDCYNVRATYNGTSWTLDEAVYLSEDNAYILAYYPYSESYGTTFPDGSSQTNLIPIDIMPTDNTQTDVLTCGGVSVNYDNPTATLGFGHVLSRIVLSIGLTGEIETVNLTSVSISQSSGLLQSAAVLGIEDGNFGHYSSDSYDTEDAMAMTCDTTLTLTNNYTVDFLIAPESSTSLTATLVIDGVTLSADITSSSDWVSAYQYTYAINVVGTVEEEEEDILLEVSSSSVISGWSDQGTSEEIELTYQEEGDTITINGYEAVDLGLSVRWATCNVGADSPEDRGNYYAWGETYTKSKYNSSTCSTYGVTMDDFSGDSDYDTATANWGGSWRMPTSEEMQELVDDCSWEWATNGYLVTGQNGNSIFIIAAGVYDGSSLSSAGSSGYYWSSTPYESNTSNAYGLNFNSGYYEVYNLNGRGAGRSVRPVSE